MGLVFLLSASPVLGHGGRAPFLLWGGLPRSSIPCQRAIGTAARLCALGAAQTRLRCLLTASPRCTPEQIEQQRRRLEARALDLISQACTDRAVAQLGFVGVIEAQADIANNCARGDRDLSAIFGISQESTATATCTTHIASAAVKLLRVAVKNWQNMLDRIAYKNVPPSRKASLLASTRTRIGKAKEKLRLLVSTACPGAPIASLPAPSLEEVLTSVALLAECIAGAAYVQDAVHCTPLPTTAPASP
ncbi:hypothetical protein HRbin30_01141 [bacterium HR30]|nr:hypothetical protein HRbin30_01141 [bacterium HR30]